MSRLIDMLKQVTQAAPQAMGFKAANDGLARKKMVLVANLVSADVKGLADRATGTDAGLFEIVGTELYLMAGTSLDFETDSGLDVTVEVDDSTIGATPDDTALLSISITDVNELPSVALANTTTTSTI